MAIYTAFWRQMVSPCFLIFPYCKGGDIYIHKPRMLIKHNQLMYAFSKAKIRCKRKLYALVI